MTTVSTLSPVSNGDIPTEEFFNISNQFGDGSDGAWTSSGSHNFVQGTVYNYTSFNLQNGHTLTAASTSGSPIIIKVKGNVIIAGTINLKGKGYAAATGMSNKVVLVQQGTSNAGILYQICPGIGGKGISGVYASDTSRRDPYGGTAFPSAIFCNKHAFGYFISGGAGGGASVNVSGAGGCSGAGGAGYDDDGGDGQSSTSDSIDTNTAGAGGAGGGAILIFCGGDLTFSGTIDVSGNDGQTVGGTSCGSGGGGGGMAWILVAGSISDSGVKTYNGGAGGTGDRNGGDGGDGVVKIEAFYD